MSDVPPAVAARIRRPAPPDHQVVEGSLPVISFGDYRSAEVATLALNPSSLEFLDRQGNFLVGNRRRLASLVDLERTDPQQLRDEDVAQVFADSNTYFGRNPYCPWFQWLEKMLVRTGLGSFLDSTACHLDLVQWATRPAQRGLDPAVWQRLVDADREFLAWQLGEATARTILVNGSACVSWLDREGLVTWGESEFLTFTNANGTTGPLEVRTAHRDGKLYLGWNRPVAGPIPTRARELLQEWVAAAAAR